MKEKEHENITDRGWAAMQRTLDQEMPRRRRRVAGWWWLSGLLLLPVLGVAGLRWYQQTQQLSAPAIPLAPAGPVAKQEHPQTTNRSVELPVTAAESAAPNAVDHLNAKSPNPTSESRTTGLYAPENNRSAVQWAELEKFQPVQNRRDFNRPFNMVAILPDSPTANQPESELQDLSADLLATLPTPYQNLDREVPDAVIPIYQTPAETEIQKVKNAFPLTLGVTFGFNTERIPRINGGLIGVTADWQPLRRWGLRSGVQYAMQSLASDESLVTVITEDAYEKSSSLSLFDQSGNYGNISSFSSINTSILASVRRIHRIETPLLAYWQPLPAFRVYAGAVLNYTFLAQTSNRIFSDNQVFKVVSGRDEINRLATERLQRWQVKWQAGLGYRLGHKVELNASLQTTFPEISFKKSAEAQAGLNVTDPQNRPLVQVRQLGVTLSGVVFF